MINEIATRVAWELLGDADPAKPDGNASALSASVTDKHFQAVTRIEASACKACVDRCRSGQTKRVLLAATRPFRTWGPGEKEILQELAKVPTTMSSTSQVQKTGITFQTEKTRRHRRRRTRLLQETKCFDHSTRQRIMKHLADKIWMEKLQVLIDLPRRETFLRPLALRKPKGIWKVDALGAASLRQKGDARWMAPWQYDQKAKRSDLVGFVGEEEQHWAIMVVFALDESEVGQLCWKPGKALAAMVKQNKAEVKLNNFSAEGRAKLPTAKSNKVKSFLKYRVCEAARRAGVHRGALMQVRWVITRKETGDLKARLVFLGFTDPGLGQMKTASSTCSRRARRTFLGVSASMGFHIFRGDVKAVSLQEDFGDENRNVLAEPVRELREAMRLEHHQCIRLKNAVYGLVNAPRRWLTRVRKDIPNLGWVESTTEPCMWCPPDSGGHLRRLAVARVDVFMIAIDQQSEFAVGALQKLQQAREWGSWESQDFVQCG
ncbi:unnamed protein product, partial [Prorocentrum cordatum]